MSSFPSAEALWTSLQGEVVAVTGHRPQRLGGFGHAVDERLAMVASEGLDRCRPSQVILGMALGFDQAVAEACDGQGIPFKEPARRRYRRLLDQAAEVHVVSPGPYAASKMIARDRWMVDRAVGLMTLWDGSKDSGTGRTVAYALGRGLPILPLWPRWTALSSPSRPQGVNP